MNRDEIDIGKALVAYYGFGYCECMPFPEFLDRYGHCYKKEDK